MIDWNAPLLDAWTKMPVYLAGYHDSPQHGRLAIVCDSRGRRLPFNTWGTGVGHTRTIENVDAKIIVRTVLVSMIAQRAASMIAEQQLREMLVMENVDAWGMF